VSQGAPNRERVLHVSREDKALGRLVAEIAATYDVPTVALEMQTLMHLPRIADLWGNIDEARALAEIVRVTERVPVNMEWEIAGSSTGALKSMEVRVLEDREVRDILEQFHYLRSFREGATHYGLVQEGVNRPWALVSVSPNDVPVLAGIAAESGVEKGRTRVVSRVFSFPGAPRNSISMLLGRVARWEKRRAKMLFTYVNPNLGFTGVSYRASNWSLAGTEEGVVYHYLNRDYVTERELKRHRVMATVARGSPTQVPLEQSQMWLKPLMIFSRSLSHL